MKKYRHKKSTAYHEAGHVIVHIQSHVPFERVALLMPDEDPNYAGKVFAKKGVTCRHDAQVAILLAGNIAEAKYRRCGFDNFEYCFEDENTARNVADSNPYQPNVGRTMEEVGDWTRDCVNKRWKDVAKIAELLMVEKSLTYQQVFDALNT